MADHEIFDAGDVVLQSGVTLPDCGLAYVTHGRLDREGSNAILVFTHFGARHGDCQYLIGEDMALDPRDYFIVVLNLLGNGVSSSPGNAAPPFDRARFPSVTILDNVRLQHALVTRVLGIRRIQLAVGHSMGAQQAFHWGALYPALVERIAPICGSARTSIHNACFLEGMRAVLTADPAWRGGDYDEAPKPVCAPSRAPGRPGRPPRASTARRGTARSVSGRSKSFSSAIGNAGRCRWMPTTCSRRSTPGCDPTSATTRSTGRVSRTRSAPSPPGRS